jgi:hypothetical protein
MLLLTVDWYRLLDTGAAVGAELNRLCLHPGAVAEVEPHFVDSATRDDHEVIAAGWCWIGTWLAEHMAKLNAHPERLEVTPLEPVAVPTQEIVSSHSVYPAQPTYLNVMERKTPVDGSDTVSAKQAWV